MAKTIRFHLDEQGSVALAEGLRRYGVDVTRTPEVGLLRATDREQLEFATANGRVIATHDPDFLALHAAGIKHAGIAYCHATKYGVGNLIRMLVLVWEVFDAEELRNRVEYF